MAFRPMRIDFGSSSPRTVAGTFHPLPTIGLSGGLTFDQYLQLQEAMKRQKSHTSFWDAVKTGGRGLSYLFDKILRPSYAVASAADFGTRGGGFDLGEALHGAREGFMGRNKEGFGQVFDKWGILQGHRTLRGIAGFATDVVTDPTTALFIAAAPVTGGTSLSGLFGKTGVELLARLGSEGAERGLVKAAAYKAGKAFIDDAFVAHTPEDAARLLPQAQQALHEVTTGLGTFDQRRALGVATVRSLEKVARGEAMSPVDQFDLNFFRRGALEEELSKTPKALQLRAGVPFTNKSVPLTPGLIPVPKRLAQGGKATGFLAKAFRPGAENPELHGAVMTGRHAAEQLADEYANFARARFSGINISKDDMLTALDRFEQKGGVLKKVDEATGETKYVLNPERFQGLTNAQRDFVQAWHDVTEHVRARDEMFGVKYKDKPIGERGQIYVPHMVSRDDITFGGSSKTRVVSKLTSEKGFQKPRNANSTVAMLKAVHAMGKTPKDIISDPMELLGRRLRASASKQADQRIVETLTKTMGLPARTVNNREVSEAQAALDKATSQLEELKPLTKQKRDALHEEIKQLRIKDIHAKHDAELERLQAGARKIKYGPKTRTKAATLARYKKAIDAIPAKRQAALDALHRGEDHQLASAHGLLEKSEKMKRAQSRALTGEVNRLSKQLAKVQKGVRHPDIENAVKSGWIKPEGFDHYFPPKVAHAIERTVKVYQGDDEVVEHLANTYRKYLANWKLLVTSVNPGYRIRNSLTDFWNMWVAGVPTRAIVKYGAVAARQMRLAKSGADKMAAGKTLSKAEVNAVRELHDAYAQGVLSGLFAGDVQQMRRYLEHQGSKRGLIKEKHFLKLGEKIAQDINRNAENWGRLTHYLYRRQGQHMGVARAAREVRIAHFDYEDLTEFERKKAKAILPFYTWTRKNIPFQLRQLATRPGRYSAFPKLALESEYASGGGQGDILPDWMTNEFAFKTPWGYHVPQFGVSDLSVFNGDMKNHFLGMLSPAIKIPAELATGQKLGTGIPLHSETHPREPISDLGASIFGAIPGNPFDVGLTERGNIRGAGSNWILPYIAGQTPFTNWLINSRSSIRTGQKGGGFATDLNYLTGLNFRDANNQAQIIEILQEIKDAVARRKRGLRDEGVIPEADQSNSPFDVYLRDYLAQNLGR